MLRFVPYIGSIIAAAFPLALAVAVDPGWTMLIWTALLFFVIEPAIGHVIEPMVYGHSTGLSPVAVVISATFWTALWGPIGLVLATPLTVCLVVLGRHVERLAFLDVMFGDRPALSPPEIFYQRMLAGDPTEAAEKAEQFLKERSLSSYYDDVAMKGLQLAQVDLEREVLDNARLTKIKETVLEFTDDLEGQPDQDPTDEQPTTDSEAAAAIDQVAENHADANLPVLRQADLRADWRGKKPILCIAGRTPLDEAAAMMMSHLCGVHGIGARVEPSSALSTTNIFTLDVSDVALVCLSYLNAQHAHIRYAVRRIRRKAPAAKIVLGLWTADPADTAAILASANADAAVGSLREAVKFCLDEASPPKSAPPDRVLEPIAAGGRA